MEFFEVISVPVSDQQVAKEFYLKIGLELIIEAPMGENGKWIQLGFPGQTTSITLVNWFKNMQPGTMQGLVIRTKNIEKDVEALKSKGVKVDKIDPTPWGKFATFYDQDGNTMVLREE